MELLDGNTFPDSLVQLEIALAGCNLEHIAELLGALFIEVLGKAQSGPSVLKAPDSFLESLLEGLADSHHLAHRFH